MLKNTILLLILLPFSNNTYPNNELDLEDPIAQLTPPPILAITLPTIQAHDPCDKYLLICGISSELLLFIIACTFVFKAASQ